MMSNAVALPAAGLELRAIERIMAENKFQGYPVVEDTASKILIGYIGRTELQFAINRAKSQQMAPGHAKCFFTTSTSMTTTTPSVIFDTMAATSTQLNVDMSRFMDPTPLSVHPRLPLETVMELFKKMGPRVILVEYRGRLTGLVTVKDCLKYQFKVEAQENPRDELALNEGQERVWSVMCRVAVWFDVRLNELRRVLKIGGGPGIQLRSPISQVSSLDRGQQHSTEDERPSIELEDHSRGRRGPGYGENR
jgi:chloride channel 3/4/5